MRAHPLHAPSGAVGDALTVSLNAADQPIAVYIDLHRGADIEKGTGIEKSASIDGRAWIDDLYLDIGALLDSEWTPRHIHLLDADELADGVDGGLVTRELAENTHTRAVQIQHELAVGSYTPLEAVRRYLQNTPVPR